MIIRYRKNIRPFTLIIIAISFLSNLSYADVMTDEEMDNVYAQGISFNFDVFFSRLGRTNPLNNVPSLPSGLNNSGSSSSVTPTTTTAPNTTPSQAATTSTTPTNVPTQIDIVAGLNPTGTPGVSIGDVTATVIPDGTAGNTIGDIDIPEIPAITLPTLPELPDTGSSTTMPVSSGNNIVVIDDLAQQYLSSFVNVNAAGSVVPVMINVTVNINSTVGTINNSNALDLKNFYTFNNR